MNEVPMTGETQRTTQSARDGHAKQRALVAIAQVVALIVLTCWAFREESFKTFQQATSMVQSSYFMATPFLIALMVYARRKHLLAALRPGSVWGVVVLLLAIVAYYLTTWPFYFGYARKLTFVLALVGIVLSVAGWRVLWRSMPMLMLTFLAMPIGWYTFASLINKPERMMVRGTAMVLRAVPDTHVKVEHRDLHYTHGDEAGEIGLGDFHFGFAAPVAFLVAILFAIFVRVRPLWQLIILLPLAVPLIALGNFLRLILHGLLTIYTSSGPLSGMPRDVSMVLALGFTYLLACIVIRFLSGLFVVDIADSEDEDTEHLQIEAVDG